MLGARRAAGARRTAKASRTAGQRVRRPESLPGRAAVLQSFPAPRRARGRGSSAGPGGARPSQTQGAWAGGVRVRRKRAGTDRVRRKAASESAARAPGKTASESGGRAARAFKRQISAGVGRRIAACISRCQLRCMPVQCEVRWPGATRSGSNSLDNPGLGLCGRAEPSWSSWDGLSSILFSFGGTGIVFHSSGRQEDSCC